MTGSMPDISKDAVLEALSTVPEPELGRTLGELDMVKGAEITGTKLWAKIQLTTPACPLKDRIKTDIETAVRPLGVKTVEIEWDAQVAGSHGPDDSKAPGIKNVIAVASGKGGVGKSTVAVNLAAALKLDGARVGLMDVDIYGPSIPLMTGTQGRKPDIADGRLVPIEAHGMKCLS